MRNLPELTNAAASSLAAYKQLLQHSLHTITASIQFAAFSRSACVQAMLAVGAGGLAVNAVKGIFGGGGDSSPAESSKQDQKRSSAGDDQISKALESLSKSGMLTFFCFSPLFSVYVNPQIQVSIQHSTLVEPANLHRGKECTAQHTFVDSALAVIGSQMLDTLRSPTIGAMPDCCHDQCCCSH